jgi:hypothetical protein
MWLELHAADPALRLRVRRDVFQYDYLGDRRALGSRANFRLLVGDVARFAGGAIRSGLTDAVARGRLVEEERRAHPEPLHEVRVTALLTRASGLEYRPERGV